MKILVTGAKGFIGKNLISELHNQGYQDIYEYDKDTDPDSLEKFCYDCDFVFNLAGVNRPENPDEFMKGNYCFVTRLLETLKKYQNACPVMVSSSMERVKKREKTLSFLTQKRLVQRYIFIVSRMCLENGVDPIITVL